MLPPFVMAAELKPSEHPERPAFHLEYVAPRSCPSREDFLASVLRRVSRAPNSSDEAKLEFHVKLAESGELAVGSLSVRAAGTTTDEVARTVSAAACAEVADALALMTALVIEEEPTRERARREPLVTREEEPSAAPAKASPERIFARRERTLVETPPDERAHDDVDLPGTPRLGGAAAAGIESGPARSLMPAFTLGAAVQFVARSIFAPSLRLQLVYGEAEVTTSEGGAIFRLLTSRFNVCPVKLSVTWANMNVCAVMDAGTLRASGADGTFWVAAGGGVRAEIPVSPFLNLEAAFDARAPLRSYRFVSAQSNSLVHEVPGLATSASVGVSAWGL